MRLAILLLPLVASQCITAALHEVAFPDSSEYDHANESTAAAQAENGFRICMRGPQGLVELHVQPVTSDHPLTTVLPLAVLDVFGDRAWQSSVIPGCSIQNSSPGRPVESGSLLLANQLIALPHSERRAIVSPAAFPASARIVSLDISADNKHLRLHSHAAAPLILKRAGPGDFDPGFSPYIEDQWIATESAVDTVWRAAEILDQKTLAVYFVANDGRMHLRTFPMSGFGESTIVYVAHLAERPEPNRPYLVPLYPFAAILDVLTLTLQVAIWYEDARRTAACFNW